MKRYDVIVVGAGPAGLSSAIEAAKRGLKVVVFDENSRPGGQLFKQIHKFFGSKEHKAKIRGFKIGEELLKDANDTGVECVLDAVVIGLYLDKEVVVKIGDEVVHYKGDTVIIATGASENMVTFDGWTLPGVVGAGAAQTMMNLHGVQIGKKILILGSGNVGLVVGYQLLQAGCEVVAVVDAAPKIGGYGVHAAKMARCGVPFYLSHTIIKAEGDECVTGVTIGEVDGRWKIIPGTEKHFDVDTICLAVGLSPMSQLTKMAGCSMEENPKKGGLVPVCDEYGETSIKGIFAAGDVSGIEEASSAMIGGKISGVSACYRLGFIDKQELKTVTDDLRKALSSLRQGMFGPENKGKDIEKTQEGIDISKNLLKKGYLTDEEIMKYPGVKSIKGIHAVIECSQNIPCNPCQDACPKKCIKVGANITSLPIIDEKSQCIGCGMCVASCSGQSIFLIDEDYEKGYTSVTLPYEFLPLPEKGMKGRGLDRSGKEVCEVEVVDVKSLPAFDHTNLLTIKVPKEMGMRVRFFKK
ncbi:MAG: FAD-dependent oxidoreductase [Clostridium tyrobutyricum]|jgi:thioredoxin reductase/Fe-S-cluster-containing hydrogenase component 2|uniref:FAD-dependent oxidoreductase n=1 Tax=Clostridium tyrobutyricum TaxID=1519 RepID=UPI00242C1D63|nr:FAD-dependent oxidoreductase [Clostridium tyrobutyricum]MCH4199967.1 FAD-dependent oxidoreductase [Clostridium tyrobutyricum]MCH4238167.1 FAD-dependent oxidoreductase [Clostridium tyrobutyricum]MCH4259958.1 FAD-dependent oxidoreductase [Clostridium tyrobutyricum]MCI1240317.1 FAD-dependent oxidoreductase [Clostridium tyrobutyricum]MCI1653079.1 FAD-dependent oxidoreductase [Clostridium tyrobutyricum]